VRRVSGLSVFPDEASPHNMFYVVVDPLKKEIRVLKKDFKPFW
jgi:hypothetical protein